MSSAPLSSLRTDWISPPRALGILSVLQVLLGTLSCASTQYFTLIFSLAIIHSFAFSLVHYAYLGCFSYGADRTLLYASFDSFHHPSSPVLTSATPVLLILSCLSALGLLCIPMVQGWTLLSQAQREHILILNSLLSLILLYRYPPCGYDGCGRLFRNTNISHVRLWNRSNRSDANSHLRTGWSSPSTFGLTVPASL